MAKLIKQVLGKVSGAVGDVLFRVRAGNNYVGTRPASYMPGTDAKSVARRQRFALANKFAKAVNIIPPLKSLWKQFKSPVQSAFNFIMKKSYHSILPDDLANSISLVPDLGFSAVISSATNSQTEIKVIIDALGNNNGINPISEPNIQLAIITFFKSPTNDNLLPTCFLSLLSPVVPTSITQPLTFVTPLSDADKKTIHYSNTYKKE